MSHISAISITMTNEEKSNYLVPQNEKHKLQRFLAERKQFQPVIRKFAKVPGIKGFEKVSNELLTLHLDFVGSRSHTITVALMKSCENFVIADFSSSKKWGYILYSKLHFYGFQAHCGRT